jgi:hypothetical protein
MPGKILPLEIRDSETGDVIGERITPHQIQDWQAGEIAGASVLDWQISAQRWFDEDRTKVDNFITNSFSDIKSKIRSEVQRKYTEQTIFDALRVNPKQFVSSVNLFIKNALTYTKKLLTVIDNMFKMVGIDGANRDIQESMANSLRSWFENQKSPENFINELKKDMLGEESASEFTQLDLDIGISLYSRFKATIGSIPNISTAIKNIPYLNNYFKEFSAQDIHTMYDDVSNLVNRFKSPSLQDSVKKAVRGAYVNYDYWKFVDENLSEFFQVVNACKKDPSKLKKYLSMKKSSSMSSILYWNFFTKGLLSEIPELKIFVE